MTDTSKLALHDFQTEYDVLREEIDAALLKYLPKRSARPQPIHEAILDSILAGGKRLRPALVVGTARSLASPADPLPAAVAVECLHTYSLIHDDLPGIDDSALRRGQPTCHTVHGEALAILAGDALLTHAFRLLSHEYTATPALANQLVSILSEAADSEHLIGGQVEDIALDKGEPSPDLTYIQDGKTGAMLSASLEMGVVLAGGNENQRAAARGTGVALGRAYQIVDDILDVTKNDQEIGKPAGIDARNAKMTWVSRHGLGRARKDVSKYTLQALEACRRVGDLPFIEALICKLENRVF
jgi:geranylgeranyl pyrophosphate synthase